MRRVRRIKRGLGHGQSPSDHGLSCARFENLAAFGAANRRGTDVVAALRATRTGIERWLFKLLPNLFRPDGQDHQTGPGENEGVGIGNAEKAEEGQGRKDAAEQACPHGVRISLLEKITKGNCVIFDRGVVGRGEIRGNSPCRSAYSHVYSLDLDA
jgi:hypothetical protein